MENKKILFADDDPEIREALRLLLQCEGYETEEASCGEELLQRALDNLYSNLQKYADPVGAVWIACEKKEKTFQISIYNAVRKEAKPQESTGIGLNTCKRLIKQMGGSFCAENDGSYFAVTIDLPLI